MYDNCIERKSLIFFHSPLLTNKYIELVLCLLLFVLCSFFSGCLLAFLCFQRVEPISIAIILQYFFFVLWSMFSVQQLRLQVQFTTRTNTVLSTLNSVSVSVWFMNMTTTTPTKKKRSLMSIQNTFMHRNLLETVLCGCVVDDVRFILLPILFCTLRSLHVSFVPFFCWFASVQTSNVVFLTRIGDDEVKKENRRICNKCVRCSNTIRIHKLWWCSGFFFVL